MISISCNLKWQQKAKILACFLRLSAQWETICFPSDVVTSLSAPKSCRLRRWNPWRQRSGLRTIIDSSAYLSWPLCHFCQHFVKLQKDPWLQNAAERDRSEFRPSSASSLPNRINDASDKESGKYRINSESKWQVRAVLLLKLHETSSAWTRQQFNVQCPAEISAFVLGERVPAARHRATRNLHAIWALRIFSSVILTHLNHTSRIGSFPRC